MVNPLSDACGFVASRSPVGKFTYVIAASVILSDVDRRVGASDTPNAWPSVFPNRCGPRLIKSLLYLPKAHSLDGFDPGFGLLALLDTSQPDSATTQSGVDIRVKRTWEPFQ